MNKDVKNILIVTAVTLGTFGLFYLVLRKKKPNSDSDINYIMDNKTEKVGSLIFSTPATKLETYPLIFIFGGINYATPSWMLSQTPKDILAKAIIVFVPYTTSYSSAKTEVQNYLSKNNLKINATSIIGFSAGGLNVQKAYSGKFKFVGLIDPSTRSEYLSLPFSTNTKMVYNDANWVGLENIKATLPKLDSKVASSGGNAEKVKLRHADIPKYFFDKFKNEMV